jgi:hypothetical protein
MNLKLPIFKDRFNHLWPLINLPKICIHEQLLPFFIKFLIEMQALKLILMGLEPGIGIWLRGPTRHFINYSELFNSPSGQKDRRLDIRI